MAVTCSFYIKSKNRSCKFERAPNSIYCNLHNNLPENKDEGYNKSLKVPCFIDGRHLISMNKIRSHIIKCSRIRDIAFELSQPFYLHNGKPPKQLSNIYKKLCELNNSTLIQDKKSVSEEGEKENDENSMLNIKLRYINDLHSLCEQKFGRNPHFTRNPVESECSGLNKNEIQARCIANESRRRFNMHENSFLNHEDSLIVELGAGNAILTSWFVKQMINKVHLNGENKLRCVVVDRESRRKQLEKTDCLISPLRLRLDIESFDFGSLLSVCNSQTKNELAVKKDMYFTLETGKNVPWIITCLIESGAWVSDSNSNRIRNKHDAEKLSVEEIKHILHNLSKGGGPDVQRIEKTILNYFVAKPVKEVFVLSKHLCGSGFDLGLKVPFESKSKMNRPSKLRVAMSPCCHHRCEFDQHLGIELLKGLIPHDEHFSDLEECFKFITTISSWATGTNDWRSDFGFKAKYILDSCRLNWLYEHKFEDICYSKFVDKSITPENMLITATLSID